MSTLTGPKTSLAAPAPAARRRPHLSGMTWLVWRQHRASYWTLIALTAVGVAGIAWQRSTMVDYLSGYGWPHLKSEDWLQGFNSYGQRLAQAGLALSFVPVLLGVFVGAPLLAPDLENGTAKLVATQSASRMRWITTKFAVTGLVLAVGTALLSVAYNWWWSPVRTQGNGMGWTDGAAFDTTGPMPVALTLFLVAAGVVIGMLLRRTLTAMVVTFGLGVFVKIVWELTRLHLGTTVTLATHHAAGRPGSFPTLPDGAFELDRSYVTGSGRLLGWSTCVHEPNDKAVEACLRKADVVGWSVDYLPISQMSSMQWLGAGILLALTAALVAFVFVWGRRRLV
ncbi:ABC-2 transporter permease [Streptomyces gibsoniae]|uniref:ABC transporter permease subunit n=1 Tax=Streptomyces gibsoniae TaxID=3075529 RepID=A0ABU2U3J1_9ACTN|nr:ABC transporter permease subunit [Streptomyces sp. DSM 41699]MDT0467797.1 ABC transporter permease subunit [Streptomyces sp. DSM 41699]